MTTKHARARIEALAVLVACGWYTSDECTKALGIRRPKASVLAKRRASHLVSGITLPATVLVDDAPESTGNDDYDAEVMRELQAMRTNAAAVRWSATLTENTESICRDLEAIHRAARHGRCLARPLARALHGSLTTRNETVSLEAIVTACEQDMSLYTVGALRYAKDAAFGGGDAPPDVHEVVLVLEWADSSDGLDHSWNYTAETTAQWSLLLLCAEAPTRQQAATAVPRASSTPHMYICGRREAVSRFTSVRYVTFAMVPRDVTRRVFDGALHDGLSLAERAAEALARLAEDDSLEEIAKEIDREDAEEARKQRQLQQDMSRNALYF